MAGHSNKMGYHGYHNNVQSRTRWWITSAPRLSPPKSPTQASSNQTCEILLSQTIRFLQQSKTWLGNHQVETQDLRPMKLLSCLKRRKRVGAASKLKAVSGLEGSTLTQSRKWVEAWTLWALTGTQARRWSRLSIKMIKTSLMKSKSLWM